MHSGGGVQWPTKGVTMVQQSNRLNRRTLYTNLKLKKKQPNRRFDIQFGNNWSDICIGMINIVCSSSSDSGLYTLMKSWSTWRQHCIRLTYWTEFQWTKCQCNGFLFYYAVRRTYTRNAIKRYLGEWAVAVVLDDQCGKHKTRSGARLTKYQTRCMCFEPRWMFE